MLDIRYHMFYLCAVFLMMGIGILIGEALYPHQEKVQATLLQRVRAEANQAIAAQGEFTRSESAIDDLRPALVRGKLTGKRVLIVVTGDYPDAASAAADAVTDAGATVSATVTLTGGWSSLDAVTSASDMQTLATVLAQGTASKPQNRQVRDSLETQDLIEVEGDLSKPAALFVLVGGRSDPAADGQATVDLDLATELNDVTQNNVVIVGCEPLNAAVSVVQAYEDDGLATVDCIDQPLGKLDLPFALAGEFDSYGLKPTAARQLPASLDGSGSS